MINKQLEPLSVPIGELCEDPHNTQEHGARSVRSIAESLREFGQQKPIVALADGTVIAGNGTLRAAKQLGWERIAVVTFENEKYADAYKLTDNRTGKLSKPKKDMTLEILDSIKGEFDVEKLGWSPSEISRLFDDSPKDDLPKKAKPVKINTEQRAVFEQAAEKVRAQVGDDADEGRILELICADYLAGVR